MFACHFLATRSHVIEGAGGGGAWRSNVAPTVTACLLHGISRRQGRTHGGGEAPLGPENTIFSGFLPLNFAICIFEVCFLKVFAMWED